MLKNAYFLAKIGADTAENEQHFAEILPAARRARAGRAAAEAARGGAGPRPLRAGTSRFARSVNLSWI